MSFDTSVLQLEKEGYTVAIQRLAATAAVEGPGGWGRSVRVRQRLWWRVAVLGACCRPSWSSTGEARGRGGTEGCCDARRRSGELLGAQARLAVVSRRRSGGRDVRTTSTVAAVKAEGGTGAGGCSRGWAMLIQLLGGPTKVRRGSGAAELP